MPRPLNMELESRVSKGKKGEVKKGVLLPQLPFDSEPWNYWRWPLSHSSGALRVKLWSKASQSIYTKVVEKCGGGATAKWRHTREFNKTDYSVGVKAVTTDLHILDSAHDVQQQLKQPLPRKECRQQAAQSIVLPNIFEFENSTFWSKSATIVCALKNKPSQNNHIVLVWGPEQGSFY